MTVTLDQGLKRLGSKAVLELVLTWAGLRSVALLGVLALPVLPQKLL